MKRHSPFAFVAVFFLLALGTGLAGCMTILDTTELYEEGAPCKVSTGAYHLPRRLVKVTVTYDATDTRYDLKINPLLIAAADNRDTYCLDYLANPLAEDHVGIQRTPEGLLKRVFTHAIDKSDEIAIQLIQGFGMAIAGSEGRAFGNRIRTSEAVIAEYEFDPFNKAAMREVNGALHLVGYCIYLDRRDDPFVPEWSGRLCDAPRRKQVRLHEVAIDTDSEDLMDRRPRFRQSNGILYRPNLTHTLVVVKREDPDSDEPWVLDTKQRIEMPNVAPIFSVQVERAIFSERKTDIDFDNGVLMDVRIEKPSELSSFMNIPLAAAQVIVGIPTQILKIRINTAENRQAVINANAQLLAAINAQEKEGKPDPSAGLALTAANSTVAAAGGRTLYDAGGGWVPAVSTPVDQCVSECRVSSGEAECRNYCSCRQLCAGNGDDTSCRASCAQGDIGGE
jgi:hypothetical protein